MSPDTKRFETLRACAALAGMAVSVIENDFGEPAYIVSKGAVTSELGSLDALAACLGVATQPEPALAGAGEGDE